MRTIVTTEDRRAVIIDKLLIDRDQANRVGNWDLVADIDDELRRLRADPQDGK